MKSNQIKYIVVVPHSKNIVRKEFVSHMQVAVMEYVDVVDFDAKTSKWVDKDTKKPARNWTKTNIGRNGYLMNYFEWRFKNPDLIKGCKQGGSWVVGNTLVISGQEMSDPMRAIMHGEIPTLQAPSLMSKYGAKSVKFKK